MSFRTQRFTQGRRAAALFALLLMASSSVSFAEPYLAVRMGLKCVSCHVSPTGGGMRNDFGTTFAQQVLPQQPAKDGPIFSGKISDLLRVGADFRADWSNKNIPHQPNEHAFEIARAHIYGSATLIPQRLMLYIDQRVAPGASQSFEAYVRYGNAENGWYVKGGKFYLPFGLRLQDNGAFPRLLTAISMSDPDTGVEFGYEQPKWSAQVAVSQGVRNDGLNSGSQAVASVVWLPSSPVRFGASAGTTDSDLGDRKMAGLFTGVRTGPIAWLAEVDYLRDEAFADGAHKGLSGLLEANWSPHQGHNLKLTGEYMDLNRDTDGDTQRRWSAVYEFTPLPFVQLRAGYRHYDGIETSDSQNRKLTFIELHGFF